jgi:hypothetical protein
MIAGEYAGIPGNPTQSPQELSACANRGRGNNQALAAVGKNFIGYANKWSCL